MTSRSSDLTRGLVFLFHKCFPTVFLFLFYQNDPASGLEAPESVTNVTKCNENSLIKTTLVTLVTLFFEKLFSFSFFRGKTLLVKILIKKCFTVIGVG